MSLTSRRSEPKQVLEKEILQKYNKILSLIHSVLGTTTTFGIQLTDIGKQLFGTRYIGTFASNQVPMLKNGEKCIVNLDKNYQSGSHWVACLYENNNYYIYDSFGRKTVDILPEFNRITIDADYDAEQNDNEKDCGSRCIAFLWFAERYGIKNALKI